MVRCPMCGAEFESEPLKTWRFGIYEVRRYKCPSCGGKFNLYWSEKTVFTIPKGRACR